MCIRDRNSYSISQIRMKENNDFSLKVWEIPWDVEFSDEEYKHYDEWSIVLVGVTSRRTRQVLEYCLQLGGYSEIYIDTPTNPYTLSGTPNPNSNHLYHSHEMKNLSISQEFINILGQILI